MNIPQRWGFCFEGNETAFTNALLYSLKSAKGGPFVYLEIGIGRGDCLRSVSEILQQVDHGEWRVFGVDLPNYRGDALKRDYVPALFGPVAVGSDTPSHSVALHLCGSKQFLENSTLRPNFTFIDACHCAKCPTSEFIGIESKVPVGGVVCFHDTCPSCQGNHSPQPCGGGIDVRRGVRELGLLDNSRNGWRVFDETHGQPQRGSHGCLFVERVAD